MPKIYRVQSVSFPDERLLHAAQVKAKAQRRSLSNYVCGLIEADLGWDPDAEEPLPPERLGRAKTAVRPPARGGSRGSSSASASESAGVLAAAEAAAPSRPAKSRRK